MTAPLKQETAERPDSQARVVPLRRSFTEEEVILEVVAAVQREGLSYKAAAELFGWNEVDTEFRERMFHMGLGAVAMRWAGHARKSQVDMERYQETDRAQELFGQVAGSIVSATDALRILYAGIDGKSRELYDFSANDHRYRMQVAESQVRTFTATYKFHSTAVKLMESKHAQTIRGLGEGHQDVLRGLAKDMAQ